MCALVLLSFASAAAAQSTASFPEPAGPPKNVPVPAAKPAPAPVPAAKPAPAPVPAAKPAPASAAAPAAKPLASAPSVSATDSTTDSRYPTLPRALPPPTGAGGSFYPGVLPYREGLPIPAGYRVEHRSANGLIAGGVATLLVAYATAIAVGGGDSFKNGTGWLVLPVIGPWAAIGARSYHCTNDPTKAQQCIRGAFNEVQTIAILSADAVVQATGAVLFLAGLGSGRDELVRSDLETGVRLTPRAIGSSGFGLGFDGRF